MSRRRGYVDALNTKLGRKTIADAQTFAKGNRITIPDSFVASGEGGSPFSSSVNVQKIRVTTDPAVIGTIERGVYVEPVDDAPADSASPKGNTVKRGKGIWAKVLAGRNAV